MGVVLVASAGNNGISSDLLAYPAAYDHVIAVAATDNNDERAEFSNYGSWVDIAAPGVNIISLRAQGTDMYCWPYYFGETFIPPYDYNAILCDASGTSMSCPHVAGIAALILSKDPSLNPKQVRTILRSSAESPNTDTYIGIGRANADYAVQMTAPVVSELDTNEETIDGIFKIKGNVEVGNPLKFQEYVIEYGFGSYPDTWIELTSSDTQPLTNVLYTWNTKNMQEGAYSFRLRTEYDGYSYIDRAFYIIDNEANDYYIDDDFNSSTPGWGIDHFNNIQYAIDICGKKDTINVASGTYREELEIIGKSVKLVGENKYTTIIDIKEDQEYNPITLILGSIDIRGFTLKSKKVPNSIYYYPSISGLFSSSSIITDNLFTNISGGVYLAHSSKCIITNNIFDKADVELTVLFPTVTLFAKNIVSENTFNSGYIALVWLYRNEVFDNYFYGGLGGIVLDSNHNEIYGNEIDNCEGIIICGTSGNNIIYENDISNGQYGVVFIFPMPGKSISKNYIFRNNIINNDKGIAFDFDEWDWDHGSRGESNIITENNLVNNMYGCFISEYSNIYDNKFYLNNFDNNDENVMDEIESNTIWYSPLLQVGNYWSDYTEKYPDAEKVIRFLLPDYWDIPYDVLIDGSNQDLYPLVEPHDSSQSTPSQPGSQPSKPNSNPNNN